MSNEIIHSVLRDLRAAGTDDLFARCGLAEAELAVYATALRETAPDAVLLAGADLGTIVVGALHGLEVFVAGFDPVRAAQLERRLPHVRFIPGEPAAATAAALAEIGRRGRKLDLVLLDGAAVSTGALAAVLTAPVARRRVVFVHGSGNAPVRARLQDVAWSGWKSVHAVDLDFVSGPGGLARALQRPDARVGELAVSSRCPAAPAPRPLSSLYRTFAELDEAALHARLAGGEASAAADDPAFLALRGKLLPRIADWKTRGARVAVYGAGKHTQALLGLVPELFGLVVLFLDRSRTADFLGKPCRAPAGFTAADADAIVYSSRAAEREMFAALRATKVEHVLLYEPVAESAPAAAPAGDASVLAARLEKAQAQLTELQLSVAALNRAAGRPPEPQDLHFTVVHQHLQLGVRYAVSCAVPGDIAEFGTMAGRTASVIAEAMKAYDRFTPQERKTLHLFDSFRGLPEAESEIDRRSPHVAAGVWGAGTCLGISEEELVRKCAQHLDRDRVRTYAGWFADTLPALPADTRFALLHIDCDLYQSTRDVLDACFSRGLVSPGAALFFDDWNCNAARPEFGERRAWTEAVALYRIEATDCGEYGMGCRKFVVHAYTPLALPPVRSAGEPRRLSVAG